jgi:hypothetical protein
VDLSHEILHYDDETLPLVANDLTRLAKQEIVPKTEGKFRALRLQFNLPKVSEKQMICEVFFLLTFVLFCRVRLQPCFVESCKREKPDESISKIDVTNGLTPPKKNEVDSNFFQSSSSV